MATTPDPLLLAAGVGPDWSHGDSQVDNLGRTLMVAGLRQWYARIGRLLAASAGTILDQPTLGAGGAEMVGEAVDDDSLNAAVARARATLLNDPLTQSVDSLSADMPDTETVRYTAAVTLKNGQTLPTVTWTMSQ